MPSYAKTYAPIGVTPIIECDSKNRDFVSISGVISPDGYAYFEVRENEGFKQQGLLRFIRNVTADCLDRTLFVWDNAPSHTSNTVKDFLAKQSDSSPCVWLVNLPPYSPELNPIELVWGYLKKKLANQFCKTTTELRKIVTETLNQMKKNKDLIKSFFRHSEMECYQF